MTKKIYLSGQMTGLDQETVIERFKTAETFLRECLPENWITVNPAEIYPGTDGGNFDHAEWMRIDLAILGTCDAIFMLPGWEASAGAKEEHDFAGRCDLEIYGFAGSETATIPAEEYKSPIIEQIKKDAAEFMDAATGGKQ